MNKLVFLLLLIINIFSFGCKHHEEEKEENTRFVVSSPIVKDTIIQKDYMCQIRSIQHIEVRALEKGYIKQIYIDEGKFVKQGQPMFQIMPNVLEAEVQKAQAEVNFAEIEFQNSKTLADSNIISKNELALSKAKLGKAKAELLLAQTHLGFTEIKAPFDGITNRLEVRLGSLVDEGELLTTLSDNSKMWVYFNVPEAEYLDYISKTNRDSVSKVHLQLANNSIFDNIGTVETIEADFNNETGNIAFRATFPNPNGVLRHGSTGNIIMNVHLENAIIIPQKATFEILDKKYVFVVDENNIVKTRQIEIGSELPHIYVVTKGLKKSDKIVVEGLRKVNNNQKIEFEFKNFDQILTELNKLHAE